MEETVRNAAVAVGTTASEVASEQGINGRKSIYLRNTSSGAAAAAVITITFSRVKNAVSNEGYVLNPGEYFIDSVSEGYSPYSGPIRAISTLASSQLTIVERF